MKNVGTVEVLTEQGVRSFPHEEEVQLVASVTRVRMASAAALAACTLTGNVLEADAVGSVGAIDTGVTPVVGDLILLKNQVAGLQNGVWEFIQVGGTAEKFKLRRAVGWDVSARVKAGRLVTVSEGTANGNKLFMLTTNDPITLNTTELVFGSALASSVGNGEITNAMLADDAVGADELAADAVVPGSCADAAVLPGTSAVGYAAVPYCIFVNFAAGGATGTPDDVFVTDAVPSKSRIIGLDLSISTGIAASTITLRSAAAGGGTALSDDIATTAASDQGVNPWNHTSFPEIAAGSDLYLRRSDRAVVGMAAIWLLPVA